MDLLVDVVINSGAKLFVSAVGVAPRSIVDKLHAAGIYYMASHACQLLTISLTVLKNMVGHPKVSPNTSFFK